jgi:hypothetical protein
MDALLDHIAAAIVRVVVVEIVIVRPEPDPEAGGKESPVMEAMAEAVTESRIERAGREAVSLKRGKAVRWPGNADTGGTDCSRAREAVAEVSIMRSACAKISACAGATAPATAAYAPTTGVTASAPTAASTKPAAVAAAASSSMAATASSAMAGRQCKSRREQAD